MTTAPPPSPPSTNRPSPRWIAIGVAAIVVLGLAAGIAIWTSGAGRGTPATGESSSAPKSSTPPAANLPTYRADAPPAIVLGPTFSPQEETKIQAFPEWPFAFRTTPETACELWIGRQDYKAYNCRQGTEPQHIMLSLVVRKATNECNAEEQSQLEKLTPLAPGSPFVVVDERTRYADANFADIGRIQFTIIHCFGGGSGRPPASVVIYQGNAPADQRDLVLKMANDIRSQTG